MSRAFISYAREDGTQAERLAALIEGDGWAVWWDPHLSAGQAYDEEIQRHLGEADAVVVLWSRSSAGSRWVKAEADVGMDRDVLVPARLDDTDIPLPFHRLQTADLTGWDGAADHPGMIEIRNALARLESGDQAILRPVPPAATSGSDRRWWWIGGAALLVLVAIGAYVFGSTSGDDDATPRTGTFVVPDVEGMRLDEARLPLAELGIVGPSLRDVQGESFPDDSGDLETVTRVKVISPPPGTEVDYEYADLTLFLEYCDGTCPAGGP